MYVRVCVCKCVGRGGGGAEGVICFVRRRMA